MGRTPPSLGTGKRVEPLGETKNPKDASLVQIPLLRLTVAHLLKTTLEIRIKFVVSTFIKFVVSTFIQRSSELVCRVRIRY